MKIVRSAEYEDMKKSFFRKHKEDFQCDTRGSSAENYRKTYSFKDGATWYEVMTKETVTERVEIKFCNVKVSVDMMKIEFWNSDESSSKVYYESWNMVDFIAVYFSKY